MPRNDSRANSDRVPDLHELFTEGTKHPNANLVSMQRKRDALLPGGIYYGTFRGLPTVIFVNRIESNRIESRCVAVVSGTLSKIAMLDENHAARGRGL